MSSEIAIKVENLSKCYQIYDHPRNRLKQFIFPRIQRATGRRPQQYYREFWALRDVSFEVKRGEAVGIVGRNGSGKSTLLQMICGTLNPTIGSVYANGRIAALLELGSGFNPEFTGRENVYLNGTLLGLSRSQINEKFDSIAGFADIGEHLDQPVKTYSSGMMVRLAFAVQVQVEPDILVVDEALAVGDWLFQKRCFQRIERLIADGTTLLFVSHDQESVRTITNRALLLKSGVCAAWGTSSEVVLEYRRILHEEETRYFNSLIPATDPSVVTDQVPGMKNTVPDDRAADSQSLSLPSEKLSFGDGYVKVISVEIFDAEDRPCSVFHPGDRLRIRVTCRTSVAATNLNVGLRLRNREGVKVYSWGTLNQDMSLLFGDVDSSTFWKKSFFAGEIFGVDFVSDCPLGANLYEVQAAVSYEESPDYLSQRILHWVDEAAFFQVVVLKDRYFFGGVSDLRMKAIWV